jgi:hypothetical protein
MNIALEALKYIPTHYSQCRRDNDGVPVKYIHGFPWKAKEIVRSSGLEKHRLTRVSWEKPSAIIWVCAEVNIVTQVRSSLKHFFSHTIIY